MDSFAHRYREKDLVDLFKINEERFYRVKFKYEHTLQRDGATIEEIDEISKRQVRLCRCLRK